MNEPKSEEIEIQRLMLDDERDPFVIRFYFNNKSSLYGFIANGETGFTQYGLDIIAAGVSALIINTIHSLQHLTKDEIETGFVNTTTLFEITDKPYILMG
ncbi:hypothetical protein D3C75_662860 [compost metagenome]